MAIFAPAKKVIYILEIMKKNSIILYLTNYIPLL